jgi:hypothetical protein
MFRKTRFWIAAGAVALMSVAIVIYWTMASHRAQAGRVDG